MRPSVSLRPLAATAYCWDRPGHSTRADTRGPPRSRDRSRRGVPWLTAWVATKRRCASRDRAMWPRASRLRWQTGALLMRLWRTGQRQSLPVVRLRVLAVFLPQPVAIHRAIGRAVAWVPGLRRVVGVRIVAAHHVGSMRSLVARGLAVSVDGPDDAEAEDDKTEDEHYRPSPSAFTVATWGTRGRFQSVHERNPGLG